MSLVAIIWCEKIEAWLEQQSDVEWTTADEHETVLTVRLSDGTELTIDVQDNLE